MRLYFPIAKVDGEQRMVWGYASTEAADDQGETVTRAALAAALDDYMQFANIREMHRPSAVGVAQEAAIDDRGLYLGAKIVDRDAWAKVVEGVYKGFSIGGRVTQRDPADRRIITGLTLTEISVVDRPANPEAVFDCWKRAIATADEGDDGAASGGAADFADPGYQADGRARYPLDTVRHIRAAWTFIHQPSNARRYTAPQLAHINARIVAAWRTHIDPHGPPANAGEPAVARKDFAAERPARIILDLDWLDGRIAAEAAPLRQRLSSMIDELRQYLASHGGEAGIAPAVAAAPLAAMAIASRLRQANPATPAPLADGLAKLADAILPRLDALQQRVDDIARTPLPPQTIAQGIAGFSKQEDAGRRETAAQDVFAALARMSEEERTLTLIKVAHAAPIAPFSRPPR